MSCPALFWASTSFESCDKEREGVDGRIKPGHDDGLKAATITTCNRR
ncbi:hypothetical protein OCAR_4084 [Afipia carboxidovorans OM5]|nr:hypothetical protein OCAR_4084 [Afipia carboxidovorans OM5]